MRVIVGAERENCIQSKWGRKTKYKFRYEAFHSKMVDIQIKNKKDRRKCIYLSNGTDNAIDKFVIC